MTLCKVLSTAPHLVYSFITTGFVSFPFFWAGLDWVQGRAEAGSLGGGRGGKRQAKGPRGQDEKCLVWRPTQVIYKGRNGRPRKEVGAGEAAAT